MKRFAGMLRAACAAALVAACACAGSPIHEAYAAQGEQHHLAFLSDVHGTEGVVASALSGMPEDLEYVGLIGDMVGGRGDRAPEYLSSWMLGQVQEAAPQLDAAHVALIWADHDKNVTDDAGIVKGTDGYGSGPIYRGLNADGSAAYYVYAVAFYEMRTGGETSANAAAAFKTWADGIEPGVPVLVLSHVPMQALRADNRGAQYWNEALNYAATGVAGIDTEAETAEIKRNVLFLCAHNHTILPTEFFFPAGSTMDVQIDADPPAEDEGESEGSGSAEAKGSAENAEGSTAAGDAATGGETVQSQAAALEPAAAEAASGDSASGSEGGETKPPRRKRPKPQGVTSNIYYSALTAGYIVSNGNATLVTVSDEGLELSKYHEGEVISLGVHGLMGESVASPVFISQPKPEPAPEPEPEPSPEPAPTPAPTPAPSPTNNKSATPARNSSGTANRTASSSAALPKAGDAASADPVILLTSAGTLLLIARKRQARAVRRASNV